VLYNNADGVYQMTLRTKARLQWNGVVKWRPPASLKSSCTMDVRYFPFDEQRCEMKFGSWTYNIDEVDIVHFSDDHVQKLDVGMDLKGFYRSVEWDLMSAPAERRIRHYAGSVEFYPEWTFIVFLRRKALFYTTNLIIPLVSHSFLTVLVFYLPSDSREKISLCINILLSLTVYFLMLAEIIPPTSVVVPLLAEYLLFTMLLVTFSVIVTAFTLNVHFRSSATHEMPDWVRKIFLYILPRILMMKRPKIENSHDVELKHIKLNLCTCFESANERFDRDRDALRYQFGSKRTKTQNELIKLSKSLDEDIHFRNNLYQRFTPEVADAIDGAIFIANHLKQEDEFNRTKEDWKYVALVVDRIFLIIFGLICLVGTLTIICQAPMLYDNREPFQLHDVV
jgi:nicotinic acetylcholine receptor